MKIAVITPFHRTPRPWLEQCLHSVSQQTIPCSHFLVCDGDTTGDLSLPEAVQVIHLPQAHQDAGNAARAIGSVSAICQGFEAIAYLDADNWYQPHHLQILAQLHEHTRAAVCSSSRNLHALDGTLLGRCPEVDGQAFVDTSCLLLNRQAFALVAAWFLMPRSQALAGDRIVWQAIRDCGLLRAHHDQATLCYRTSYEVHFRHFGIQSPADRPGRAHSPGHGARRGLPVSRVADAS